MPEGDHSITRQTISVATADAGIARALQPALMDINEDQFLPVIAKVFDEFDRPDAEILIERLTLDLGTVPFDSLSSVATARLAAALRTELGRLLAGTTPGPDQGVAILDEEEAQLSILEYYLLNGLWPAWQTRPAALDLDRLVAAIAATHAVDLGALLYRIGTSGGVLERLVAQLDEATLELLVAALEPEHAALIIGTIAESKAAHKEEPIADMSEAAFANRVWLTTLSYLVTEPGTQFNRREFVRSLLLGMAQETGADYSEILTTFRRALRYVAERRPVRSSLPAILFDLAKEEGAAEVPAARKTSFNIGAAGGTAGSPSVDALEIPNEIKSVDAVQAADTTGLLEQVLAEAGVVFRHYDATEAELPLVSDASQSHVPPAGQDRRARMQAIVAGALAKIDETAIESLLRALMPCAMVEGTPFVESLRSHAATAVDKSAYYAGVILAALEDRSIAFAELARESVAFVLFIGDRSGDHGARAAVRDVRRIVEEAGRAKKIDRAAITLLRDAVRGISRAAPRRETVASDIMEAMRRSWALDGAKSFGVRSRGVARTAIGEIVRQDDVAAIETRIAQRRTTMAAVAALLQAMPSDAMLPMDRIAAILIAASGGPGGQRIDVAFVAKLIRESLAVPVTPAIIEALQHGLEEVGSAAGVGPTFFTMLRDAIEQLQLDMSIARKLRRSPSQSAARRANLREVAEEFLRSGRVAPRHGKSAAGAWLTDAVFDLMTEEPERAVAAIRAGALRRRTISAWSRKLPPSLLARLVAIIETRRHRLLIETAARFGALLRHELAATGKAAYRPRDLWAFVLRHSARHAGKSWQPDELLASFMREEATPRLGDTAAFAQMATRMPGGEMPDEAGRGERGAASGPGEWTVAALSTLLQRDDKESRRQALALLRAALADPGRRETLARALSPPQFEAALRLLAPRRHKRLRDMSTLLFSALAAVDARVTVSSGGAAALQRFLLDFITEHRGRSWSADAMFRAFLRQVAVAHAGHLGGAAGEAFLQTLFAHLEARAGAAVMRGIVQAIATDRGSREAMTAALSPAQFEATLRLLEPRRHKRLREASVLLFSALAAVDKSLSARFAGTAALQRFLFGFVAARRGKSWSADALILAFFREIAAAHARRLGGSDATLLQTLAGVIEAQAGTAGLRGVAQAMRRQKSTLIASAMKTELDEVAEADPTAEIPDVALHPRAGVSSRPHAHSQKPVRAPIYIDNAGLILAGPFIPHLFRTLGMLEQTGSGALKLAARDGATRAVHLLQYLVTSRTATPEPLLVLNKILAGLPTGAVIGAGIEATKEETGLCDKLLSSMLANWPALSTGTSIVGLQSTFMQREGRLTFEDDKWKLKVERKTLDVLVDQVPWGFRIIYASWMPQPLHVEW